MRITCPNCDAQYEVDDRAIPESGRDVQCSNCGHAWFQLPPHVEEAIEDEAATYGDAEPLKAPPETPTADEDAEHAAEPAEPAEEAGEEDHWGVARSEAHPAAEERQDTASIWPEPDFPETGYEEEEYEDEGAAAPTAVPPLAAGVAQQPRFGTSHSFEVTEHHEAEEAPEEEAGDEVSERLTPAPQPQRRVLDENIQAVLREEAERERKARQAEGGEETSETEHQTDTDRTATDAATAAAVAAAVTSAAATDEEDENAAASARRDLLPDIEQINSTLRAGTEQSAAAVAVAPPARKRDRRRGFRLGFRLILLLVIVVLILYVLAPSIAARYPPMAPAMNTLVTTINGYRSWLDRQLLSAVAGMHGG